MADRKQGAYCGRLSSQTEENSLGVENNSCRDQQVPNSMPHQSQNP